MSIRSGELVIISEVKFRIIPRFMKSLRVRIALLLIMFVSVSCFIMCTGVLKSYEERSVSVRTAEIQNQCTILGNQLVSSNYLENTDSAVINTELSQLSNLYNGRVVVINDEFQIVKDTYNLQEGKTIVAVDVVKCYQGEQTVNYDEKNCYIEIGTPIFDTEGKKVLGMMLVSVSTESILDNVAFLKSNAEMLAFCICLVSIAAAFLVGSMLVRPLKRMSQSIEEMTAFEGNYLHENAYNETIRISEAFNRLWERFKMLDESREEFVANVSHELKTPLTSMKVLSDSLLMQPDVPIELYQEFMSDLSEEIERENKIINDLLALVKLDKTGGKLNIQSQNINALVERILKRILPLAQKQNIELIFESYRSVTAEVDEVKMALVITNLVENAIKYNKENGWVQVSLNADHKYFYLKVTDSGIGIPKEETEHIFERFYRVDKSHSREIGGTGLGLAIVRNAVILHRGAIKVYSKLGEGTTFNVRIPLSYIAKGGTV